ncbi:hypothetical protein Bca101_006459 [Brassica carinata]
MADLVPASFLTQANALSRKNLAYQRRNLWSNVRLIVIPLYLCVLLVSIQALFDTQVNNSPDNRCGCQCIDDKNRDGICDKKGCGLEYSSQKQALFCAFPKPPLLPPLVQIPRPKTPSDSCRRLNGSCPVTTLVTGNNLSLGAALSRNMLTTSFTVNSSVLWLRNPAINVLGTTSEPDFTNYFDPGIHSNLPIFNIQPQCTPRTTFSFSFGQSPQKFRNVEVRCVQGLSLWRNSSIDVSHEILKGYQKGNHEEVINEVAAAYDLLDTDRKKLNVTIWYNSTSKTKLLERRVKLVRVPRSVNLISNAYLQYLKGRGTEILFEFVKEMPKVETWLRVDVASSIGPIFFTWVILLLFPVVLNTLVYEKQQRLRIIMKMHGLGDGPYWMISYAYFLSISTLYVICLMIFGSVIGLKFFRVNNYSIQFLFYFIYINLQISIAFLVSSAFSKVKTSSVVAYIYVFGSGLLGAFLFQFLMEDPSFPRRWIFFMEVYPGFSLYRGLYEFSEYALNRKDGMKWDDFSNSGMDEVFYIIIIEWPSLQKQGSVVSAEMEKLDVAQEREKVDQLMMLEPTTRYAIVCDNLKKMYPGRDGNQPKIAVHGLSLAVPSGECFGMLGPNGAGKTSFINMMTGLVKPSSGTAFVRGLDICKDMDRAYTSMGVCPQHDLLWETLTGREHLLFYGRLKNLKGSDLNQAVEESLKSVNLSRGGVGDKPAGKYSGGMKRRLSVAISLIGGPKVVYMDEPSTGLDPASRMNLWTVIKRAKTNTAIILTTHSMEEAEFLCDRLGIFVDGRLQCIGNPKELKGRYGGSYVFTMTTSSEHEKDVEMLVKDVSPNAKKIYHIGGTQKFEIPKGEVRISEVFQAVEKAKSSFKVFAWGLADTTLEDVFIKGTTSETGNTNYLDPGIHSNLSIFNIQARCTPNTTLSSFPFQQPLHEFHKEERCVQGLNLWRNNSMEVNNEIFEGYQKENHEESIKEIVAAYDLLDTNRNNFNVTIWYNSTYKFNIKDRRVKLVQVPRSVNLVSNAYLHFLQGPETKMLFEYVKEVPKLESRLRLDIASLIGPLFFTWVILLLFPVILTSLVYEKQQRLRIIMKMHGLGDGPYWMISYVYYLIISTLYIISLMIFGSAIGLKFFLFNDYSFQFIFCFLYINLQISTAFLVSSAFSKVETASVVSYIHIFGSGLLGAFLFQFLLEDVSFPRRWIFVMELYPGFSLYRGLYEFSIYAYQKNVTGRDGMKWKDFTNSAMDEVFYIIIVEWTSMQSSSVTVEMEKLDATQERAKVEKLMLEPSTSHAIVCDNLKKVYPRRDGNPPKMAVRGLSLAVASKECFGMLGPNGAGKTSFINTMTGLAKPTSGAAFVQGLDICKDMDKVYTSMGVCPQQDLLWETLTGREHLLFYGRLKNLKGSELNQVCYINLPSLLYNSRGVADKPAGKYSGGMKRRLSIAISLIGSPKVVYMDEPSTGLDPASRMNLWTVIKRAKRHTAIILTTHSMEEAEFLCDRLGIFVDGRLQCIGNPKELKARYGGSYVFTMTTSSEHEQDVEMLVQDLSPNAKKIYHIAGTQKFEIPKVEVGISKVFEAVEKAKSSFTVFAWGLEDTTLEDVFIKVARGAQDFNVLS